MNNPRIIIAVNGFEIDVLADNTGLNIVVNSTNETLHEINMDW